MQWLTSALKFIACWGLMGSHTVAVVVCLVVVATRWLASKQRASNRSRILCRRRCDMKFVLNSLLVGQFSRIE